MTDPLLMDSINLSRNYNSLEEDQEDRRGQIDLTKIT